MYTYYHGDLGDTKQGHVASSAKKYNKRDYLTPDVLSFIKTVTHKERLFFGYANATG